MDAFFASVEQRDAPELKGKPVIVGGSPSGRGVVAAASYEARVFGVRSAMPCREAARRCPEGIFVRGRMEVYQQVSLQIREIFDSITPYVEPVSVDEAFLDVSGVLHFGHDAVAIAENIRSRIRNELNLTASVGVAPNKFLAKIASDCQKPDGQTVVPTDPEAIRAFLAPMDVGALWGCGKKMQAKLHLQGILKVEQLQTMSEVTLSSILGHHQAVHLRNLAFGLDDRQVQADRDQDKSISAEHTFHEDTRDPALIHARMLRQAEEVGSRLRKAGLWANTVQIKIRYVPFDTRTRQKTLPASTRSDSVLIHEAQALFDAQEDARSVRLIGVGVSGLSATPRARGAGQLDLFEAPLLAEEDPLDDVVDALRSRYGKDSVKRGLPFDP